MPSADRHAPRRPDPRHGPNRGHGGAPPLRAGSARAAALASVADAALSLGIVLVVAATLAVAVGIGAVAGPEPRRGVPRVSATA
jgi:hypothetical protein